MEPKNYTVTRIEGEYAYLREEGGASEEELFIEFLARNFFNDGGTNLFGNSGINGRFIDDDISI